MGVAVGCLNLCQCQETMKLHALFAPVLLSFLYVHEAAAEDPAHHQYCVLGAGPGGARARLSVFVFVNIINYYMCFSRQAKRSLLLVLHVTP